MRMDERRRSGSGEEPERDHAFIERLQVLVGQAGSANALARKAGLSQSGFARYMGGGDPSRRALIALANAGGVSVGWLATGEGPMSQSDIAAGSGAYGWDRDLMRNCMIAADELLHELGREMDPAEKADATLKMYRSELDRKVAGQPGMSPAEVVRLFGRGA